MDDDEKVTPVQPPVPSTWVRPRTLLSIAHRASSYPTSRLSAPFAPVDQLETIKDSDRMLGAVTTGKLQIISDQIEHLKKQARDIIMKAEVDMTLHRATCSFEKRTGHTYHLYARSDEQSYFSLLSPDEWGGNPPHTYLGSYRLESDMTWTVVLPSQDHSKDF